MGDGMLPLVMDARQLIRWRLMSCTPSHPAHLSLDQIDAIVELLAPEIDAHQLQPRSETIAELKAWLPSELGSVGKALAELIDRRERDRDESGSAT